MDEGAPWERIAGEPSLWFSRFEVYRRLGPRRGLLAAARAERATSAPTAAPLRTPPGAWARAANKWSWTTRAEAWDKYLRERENARWEMRRRRLRDAEWGASQELMKKARQMLAWPLERQEKKEDDEGRQVTVVMPARWGMRDPASFFDLASKLARLATDMATSTSRHEVTGVNGESLGAFDVEHLSDEELASLLANLRAIEDGNSYQRQFGNVPPPGSGRRSVDVDDEVSGDAVAKEAV